MLDQSPAKAAYQTEFIEFFGQRLLVHVQAAVQLDLDRVDPGCRSAVADGRVPSPVGIVVGEAEMETAGHVFGRIDDGGGRAGLAGRPLEKSGGGEIPWGAYSHRGRNPYFSSL